MSDFGVNTTVSSARGESTGKMAQERREVWSQTSLCRVQRAYTRGQYTEICFLDVKTSHLRKLSPREH